MTRSTCPARRPTPASSPTPTGGSSPTASSRPKVVLSSWESRRRGSRPTRGCRRRRSGDHPGAHRGGHRGTQGRSARAQGERDHRQADPGGDGHGRYRDIATHAPDYEPLPFYSSDTDTGSDLDLAAWLADTSAGALDTPAAATPGLGVDGFASVIEDPEAAEAAIEAPATDFNATRGGCRRSLTGPGRRIRRGPACTAPGATRYPCPSAGCRTPPTTTGARVSRSGNSPTSTRTEQVPKSKS